ncbi:hypothetical protein [Paraconexibacter sp. AEG42_29]
MVTPQQVPKVIAGITLVAGVALAASPQVAAGPLGLEGHERGIRAVGLADLLLVPGLALGRPQSAWMVGRAAVSVVQAAYLDGVAATSTRSAAARTAACVLAGLAVMDATTAVRLLRAERA